MDWVQFFIFLIAVFGLFLWNRAESRSDSRHMDNKLEGQRNLMMAIYQESKDFHAQLLKLDERTKRI